MPQAGKKMTAKDHAYNVKEQIQTQLQDLYQKNTQHLQVPLSRQRVGVGKLRSVLFFLGLFLLIGLAFAAGFLTAYTFFPTTKQIIPLASQDTSKAGMGGMLTSQSYGARSALLQSQRQSPLLEQAERQAKYQATQAARSSIFQVLQRWSNSIRQTFGNFFGSAIAPLTTGLAQSAVDAALPLNGSSPSLLPSVSSSSSQKLVASLPPSTNVAATQEKENQQLQTTASHSGRFSIQIQEFSSSTEAWHLANALTEKGMGAYVVCSKRQDSLKFAVRVGQFATYKDSREAAILLNKQFQLHARVVTKNPFEERLK